MFPFLESRSDILKMLDDLTQKRKHFLDACGRLAPAQLNDPVYPGTWSVLQNLAHLAWAEAWMLAWIQKRPGPLPREERPAEPALELGAIRSALDEAHASVIAFLKANAESVLTERCQYSRQGEQTVGGVLYHLIEHELHHGAFLGHKLSRLIGPAQ
jgi:uncharacterized damage-inducible protein DinB